MIMFNFSDSEYGDEVKKETSFLIKSTVKVTRNAGQLETPGSHVLETLEN